MPFANPLDGVGIGSDGETRSKKLGQSIGQSIGLDAFIGSLFHKIMTSGTRWLDYFSTFGLLQ